MQYFWPKDSQVSGISIEELEMKMRTYGAKKSSSVRIARAYLRKVGGLSISKTGVIGKK